MGLHRTGMSQAEKEGLSTTDKLKYVNSIGDCGSLGLLPIRNMFGKHVFYDQRNAAYWYAWDPAITYIIDPDISPDIIYLPLAHDEADFAARAQKIHFQLQGREDLAQAIQTKHGHRIAIAVIPEIIGTRLDRLILQWEVHGLPEDLRPVSIPVFEEFVRVMMDQEAEVHSDIHTDNAILGTDGRIYAFDFSLDFTDRDDMIMLLREMVQDLRFPIDTSKDLFDSYFGDLTDKQQP